MDALLMLISITILLGAGCVAIGFAMYGLMYSLDWLDKNRRK
tara:strand:- start:33110 stop:33235 length:126 start_codon:yes stop_codon:yes gene_type:complete